MKVQNISTDLPSAGGGGQLLHRVGHHRGAGPLHLQHLHRQCSTSWAAKLQSQLFQSSYEALYENCLTGSQRRGEEEADNTALVMQAILQAENEKRNCSVM